ncbi:DUF1801 domain-containing protein [Sandarakinorhabdus sp. DWP1-3-1]|uniref:DUF1801 domain-containing protein n=1 Tax=Sandarakinorhabdus sp. DWP1-3-1 TaxID=2804627 RepID=UPI003CE99407
MTTAANKTQATGNDVGDFIAAIPDPVQAADTRVLCDLMQRLSGEPPVMWGPSIIGFGRYRYRYDSGREGEMCRVGFSPRKGQFAFYLSGDHGAALARLGRHKTATSCFYVRRLADIDLAVLEAIVAASLAHMAQAYPPAA